MKKIILKVLLVLVFAAGSIVCFSQSVGINATGAAPAPSAMLDVSSTTKGFLLPRMTTAQMNAIVAPAVPLLIYNTTVNCYEFWTGAAWQVFACNCLGPPPAPGAITGPVSVCSGAVGVVYSIAAVPGAVSYTWTVPAGATITAGQGTTSITVTFGATSGNVCVTATNSCGTGPATCLAVTVVTPPAAPGPISGPLTICAGMVGFIYSVPNVPGCVYTWTVAPAVGTITAGQGTNSITMNSAASPGSGTICVKATNACGTSPQTCITVTVVGSGAPITLDNAVSAGVVANFGNSTFSITTANANEIIMISYNGWNGPGAGPVTVDGNPATFINNATNGNSGSAVVYAYLAPAAGVHNIVCATAGYNSGYYNNFAAAFTGGCGTLSLAANIGINVINTIACVTGGSITASITTTLPGSVIYCSSEINEGQPITYPISWTGATFLGDDHTEDGINAGQAYEPAAVPGLYTITATNSSPPANGCGGLTIVLVIIHP